MKRVLENRYPHSATLFKFCKEALAQRYDGNIKVIDQDVGSILGYDPADCSHWKKGKKNIRSLETLKSIATHLEVDERLLIDIAGGNITLAEALFEFRGYGQFTLTGSTMETLKKDYFKNPDRWLQNGQLKPFDEIFSLNRTEVALTAERILTACAVTQPPVYIPEIYNKFDKLRLIADAELTQDYQVIRSQETDAPFREIRYHGTAVRPYMRFLLAKELFIALCELKDPSVTAFHNSPSEILDVQGNIFAGCLLVPSSLLKKEVENIDSSLDIVRHLAESFWVSNTLMNQRLHDHMRHLH